MVMSIPLSVKPKTDFSIRLKQWQGEKPDKIAADILGVNLPTFRHWKYDNIVPHKSKCMRCVESIIGK